MFYFNVSFLVFSQDQIPDQIVKKVEFGLLLYLACQNAPQNVIQVNCIVIIQILGLKVT